MKNLLFVTLLAFLMVSCTESSVKRTATEYIQKQMKDPSSFKAEKVDVILDTIPIYLNKDILSAAEDFSDAVNEKERYSNRDSYLWRDEISKAQLNLDVARILLNSKISEAKKKKSKPQYLVLMECSGKNSYGGTVSSKYIVIVDKENTEKVLGEYRLDGDFAEKLVVAYMFSVDDGFNKLKTNEYGKVETDGMTPLETFLFAN